MPRFLQRAVRFAADLALVGGGACIVSLGIHTVLDRFPKSSISSEQFKPP